jgi:hypothetical protein
MLEILAEYLGLDPEDDLYRAAAYVLSQNIIFGDAREMVTGAGEEITFAEWGNLGNGRFQRRDFRFETLTKRSSIGESGTPSDLSEHEGFRPTDSTYPPLTLKDLADV